MIIVYYENCKIASDFIEKAGLIYIYGGNMKEYYPCRVTVKVVILKNDKFLILKRSARNNGTESLWELPGGGVDADEMANQAVVREVREETAIEIKNAVPIYVFELFRKEGKIIGITYRANCDSDNVCLSDEHTEYRWIKVSEIDEFTFIGDLKKELKSYFRTEER